MLLATAQVVRVEQSPLEEVRRVLFLELAALPERQRGVVARRVMGLLRDKGLLANGVEHHFKAVQVAELISRTPEFVVKECKAGRFGRVYRDDGGWLIPASGIEAWLERRAFSGSVHEEAAS